MSFSTESVNSSMSLLSRIASNDFYDDEDEFGEILGWYLQARFGNINTVKTIDILKSLKDTPLMFNSQENSVANTKSRDASEYMKTPVSPESTYSSDSISSSDSVLSSNDHVWIADLISDVSFDESTPKSRSCSAFSKKQAIKAHIRHVLRLNRSTEIPMEAFEYWNEYRGTALPMAVSLLIAGTYRKAHDSV